MKLSKETAIELIKLWQKDWQVKNLPEGALQEIKDSGTAVHYKMFVRPFIGAYSQTVSNLCWDGRFKSAVLHLMKYGLDRQISKYAKEAYRAAADTRNVLTKTRNEQRRVNDLYASHRRSNQWGVCK